MARMLTEQELFEEENLTRKVKYTLTKVKNQISISIGTKIDPKVFIDYYTRFLGEIGSYAIEERTVILDKYTVLENTREIAFLLPRESKKVNYVYGVYNINTGYNNKVPFTLLGLDSVNDKSSSYKYYYSYILRDNKLILPNTSFTVNSNGIPDLEINYEVDLVQEFKMKQEEKGFVDGDLLNLDMYDYAIDNQFMGMCISFISSEYYKDNQNIQLSNNFLQHYYRGRLEYENKISVDRAINQQTKVNITI